MRVLSFGGLGFSVYHRLLYGTSTRGPQYRRIRYSGFGLEDSSAFWEREDVVDDRVLGHQGSVVVL